MPIRQSEHAKELCNAIIEKLEAITSSEMHKIDVASAGRIVSAIDVAKLLRLELEKSLHVDCAYASANVCKHWRGEVPPLMENRDARR